MTILSIIIPCYNEENTLEACITRVRAIASEDLGLELIIVDDCSRDKSLSIAHGLSERYEGIIVLQHDVNQGKGAALRTGFRHATGDIVAVQDADLEYDPEDLKRLVVPILENKADVVLGSRFLSSGAHRVFYFWHSMGNKFLTLFSNMFTDLNLTDMETCYKVFQREIIQDIKIHENRFGFEPEIVAEIAHRRLRIYEMGISYDGRSYLEGKKIGVRDGVRAIYCILHYNAYRSSATLQFIVYACISAGVAFIHLAFLLLFFFVAGMGLNAAILSAAIPAYSVDYYLCTSLLFRRKVKWSASTEVIIFFCLSLVMVFVDLICTRTLFFSGISLWFAKVIGSLVTIPFGFIGKKYLIFLKQGSGYW